MFEFSVPENQPQEPFSSSAAMLKADSQPNQKVPGALVSSSTSTTNKVNAGAPSKAALSQPARSGTVRGQTYQPAVRKRVAQSGAEATRTFHLGAVPPENAAASQKGKVSHPSAKTFHPAANGSHQEHTRVNQTRTTAMAKGANKGGN